MRLIAASIVMAAMVAGVAPADAVPRADDICDVDGLPPDDGHQHLRATCSDTEWGEVPDIHHMVSTWIASPDGTAPLPALRPFPVVVLVDNLSTGFTDNPNTGYESEPEDLDASGQIRGHVSLAIQRMSALSDDPPDARAVTFFHTFTEPADAAGALRVTAPGLLPGHYRVCTMAQTEAYLPVLSPVLARGAQDDCVHFDVTLLGLPANETAAPEQPPAVAPTATTRGALTDGCATSPLDPADGGQHPDGECVSTVVGEIPGANKMPSTMVRFPRNNEVIEPFQAFTIHTKTINLKTGFFDDPVKQYYIFPQTLDDNGFIEGNANVTVQRIPEARATEPLDPELFDFFKGLNDPADGNGELTALVEKGLPPGKYRLCTQVSSFAHQPTVMPIAQRGGQDDCVRFEAR